MENIRPFKVNGKTFSIAFTDTASESVEMGNTKFENVRIYNSGQFDAFVSIGSGTQTASVPTTVAATSCTPIAAGSIEIFTLPRNLDLEISVIASSGGFGVLYVTIEEGI